MTLAKEFAQKKGTFEIDLGTIHHFSDGLYAKQMMLPKGFEAISHVHNYSHLSILAKGKVAVITDEETKGYEAPVCIEIKAGVHHKIVSFEDAVWFCIHATDEKDETKVDEVLIAKGCDCA